MKIVIHLYPSWVELYGTSDSPSFFKVKNMVYRGLDQDGNAGVVFERMAQVLLRCGQAKFKLQNLKFHMYWYH